jgi:hypothetical protein
MQYASGTPGRIFYIRFDHGEDLLAEIEKFAHSHQIASGSINLIGAVSEGSLVSGPHTSDLPPAPIWHELPGIHEFVGAGVIRHGADGIKVHLHASAGRDIRALTGCFRENIRVHIIIEAVIMEFSGFTIQEEYDPQTGLALPVPHQH